MRRYQRWMTAVCSLTVLAAISGCVHQPSYQSGYDAGYREGEAFYQSGFNDGYDAGCREADAAQSADKTEVEVSGSFTATVRALIPDYVMDSVTPRAAVVTLFQDEPFVLKLNETICSQLEEGETYTFLVPKQSVFLSDAELYDDGVVSSDALLLRHISVRDFRVPTDDEYGLVCWRVNYTTEEN